MSENDATAEQLSPLISAERAKTFADAVVAIAMTLLILPLMESISDAGGASTSASDWFAEHDGQLFSFVLSFAIIAMFWINHHRMYAHVERVSGGLLWLTMAWLLTIVWLPVATAMSSEFSDDGLLVRLVYIGSMLITSLLMLVTRLYLRSHPDLLGADPEHLTRGLSVQLATTTLFAIALVVSLLVPATTYYPLLLLMLTAPVARLFRPLAERRRP